MKRNSRPTIAFSPLLAFALCSALVLLAPTPARAELLLLVHGYLGNPDDWYNSGVSTQLIRAGWSDAGTLTVVDESVRHRGVDKTGHGRKLYTAELPSEAPLQVQAGLLADLIYWLQQRHPDEYLTVAGHSAGGVVARLTMVQQPQVRIGSLITFASPHLGTPSAQLGILAARTPLVTLAPMLGIGTLSRSQALYRELLPEQQGSLLYWLNHRRHPAAVYISVVRTLNPASLQGDLLIPSSSQDMRNVAALKGRALRYEVPGSHLLSADDGRWLVGLLNDPGI